MRNSLVAVINYDKVEKEDKDYARMLLGQLDTAGGIHLMRKEITFFLEDMEEKYGTINKMSLEDELTNIKADYEEYKRNPKKGIVKLDGLNYVNLHDKICSDYELKISNLEHEISKYNKR
jgi:hypothetical protein